MAASPEFEEPRPDSPDPIVISDESKTSLKDKLKLLFPPFEWIPEYKQHSKEWLAGDIGSAVAVSMMLVPQSLAYALLAGVPPIYGLYGSAVPLLVYSFFGTSRVQAIGPTAMDALLTFSVLSSVLSSAELEDDDKVVELVIILTLVTGILQLLFGLFRLGVLASFLSYSVMSGFTSAAALTIALSQAKHVLGLPNAKRFTGIGANLRTIWDLVSNLDEAEPYTIALAVVCCIILFYLKSVKAKLNGLPELTRKQKITKTICDLSALVVTVFGWCVARTYDEVGVFVRSKRDETFENSTAAYVNIVGEVPSGLPALTVPDIGAYSDKLDSIVVGSTSIALISFMELYAIGKVYAEQYRFTIRPSQELGGLGMANIAGSFFLAIPAGGSFSRTAVAANSGARTLLSNFLVGSIIVLALLVLAPAFHYIPFAALASIIEVAVVKLVRFGDMKEAWRLHRRGDFAVMMITFLLTFAMGIQIGIGVGIMVSIILTLKRSAFPRFHTLGQVPGTVVFRSVDNDRSVTQFPGVAVTRMDAELYFANSNAFRTGLLALADSHGAIVVDASVITSVDLQGVHTIKSVVAELRNRNVRLFFAQLRHPVRKLFERAGLTEEIGRKNIFRDLSNAVRKAVSVVSPSEGARTSDPRATPLSTRDLLQAYARTTPLDPSVLTVKERKEEGDDHSTDDEDDYGGSSGNPLRLPQGSPEQLQPSSGAFEAKAAPGGGEGGGTAAATAAAAAAVAAAVAAAGGGGGDAGSSSAAQDGGALSPKVVTPRHPHPSQRTSFDDPSALDDVAINIAAGQLADVVEGDGQEGETSPLRPSTPPQ